jgi:uncharacterized CHY-type Zn-finger protein
MTPWDTIARRTVRQTYLDSVPPLVNRECHGVAVYGEDVDRETRCAHYGTERDVVAIQFACCERFYPCHACHDAVADHEAAVWPRADFDQPAILCGACGARLAIEGYLACDDACPDCGHAFNPGCADHADRYFSV